MTPYGLPSGEYHCLLDEQPYYLVPPRLYGGDGDRSEQLRVNPDCWFSWHGSPPADTAARLAGIEALHQGGNQVWVTDPATGSVWPYWVGEEYAMYLGEVGPGWPVMDSLPEHARWVLTRANILVEPGQALRRRREWQEAARMAADGFAGRGYSLLRDLIPPFQLGALRRYYRYHTRIGSFPLGDGQVSRRYVAHDEPVARFFHAQLTSAISDVARTVVKPSYSYLAAYESGSVLERHTDREQCEYTLTVSVDASPEPREHGLWPIHIEVDDGTMVIWQHLGESLLFRGRQLAHYRQPLPAGQTSTSLLLHYVDESFDGSLT
jgi:hypothetical protein